jgi:putative transposase
LFPCESIRLKGHGVLVVMDQFTCRLIGFGIHASDVDGIALCHNFNRVISEKKISSYLSPDHDPLFEYHRWRANLRIFDIETIKSVPYTPISHPFVERLMGTIRREFLDNTFFWNAVELQRKLDAFQDYYNHNRFHASLGGGTPAQVNGESKIRQANLESYRWEPHCRGLVQLPMTA